MRLLAFDSDQGGCQLYCSVMPHNELKRFGVLTDHRFTLPSSEKMPGSDLNMLIHQMSRYDAILVQRITSIELMKFIKKACHMADKAMIYINDDDYLHLESHNPCFFSTSMDGLIQAHRDLTSSGRLEEAQALIPMLEEQRIIGREQFKEALSIPDGIVTTTEELKQVFSPYNKNILVSPNCVEQVHYERDYCVEEFHPEGSIAQNNQGEWVDVSGHLKVDNKFGMASIPAFWYPRDEMGNPTGDPNRILRVGYSGTVSHQHDWETIREYWNRLVEKYAKKVWFTYIGDPYFADQATGGRDRRHWIKDAPYQVYMSNLRNLDIAIAPLAPTPFNMSKSDIKAVEAASWGVPCVLPNYITYTRTFKHGETALFYRNGKEFMEMMEELINNHRLRIKLGNQTREYVANNRMAYQHAEPRYNFYKRIIEAKPFIKPVN